MAGPLKGQKTEKLLPGEAQNVGLDNFQARRGAAVHGKSRAQMINHLPIVLNPDHPSSPFQQDRGKVSRARTDFYDSVFRFNSSEGDNLPADVDVGQEVLAQRFLGLYRFCQWWPYATINNAKKGLRGSNRRL